LPKAKQNSVSPPTPEEIAAARFKDAQDYLAWAQRVISAGWNRDCRSRRCRRNGCQDVRRCEPQQRPRLHQVLAMLTLAALEENSLRKEVRDDPTAAQRRAQLADARARGWLPF
jgi:hypothetical protein